MAMPHPADWPDQPDQSERPDQEHAAHRCPSCGGTDIERTPRCGLEHLLPRRRPYHCCACGRRFLDRPSHQR
jgi:hypothetical protein